ncbi:MAG: hypothetical protein K6F53_11510 [Lachnospiraceae bacterium]|nr:hypothetical protein [Lachnospiraceae bacterium]
MKMKKKHAYMGILMLTGIMAGLLTYRKERKEDRLMEGDILIREEWGKGDYDLHLKAGFIGEEDAESRIDLTVKEREYTKEELDLLAAKAMAALEKEILNGNPDTGKVCRDLKLPYELPGYPFLLRWEVSDESLMDRSGHILPDPLRKETFDLTLTCTMSAQGSSYSFPLPVRIIPPNLSREEELSLMLKESVEKALMKEPSEKRVSLPRSVNGKAVKWESVRGFGSLLPVAAGFLGAILLSAAADYDARKKEERFREELRGLYAGFTGKLRLYLMSGLTARNAFFAITAEYSKNGRKEEAGLLELLQTACNRLRNHVREESVYEEWGNSCGGPYRKLSFLICVNLKQGNEKLLSMLEEEEKEALLERKALAEKRGSEAGVKLLFPMILMLIVVMLLIMIPACMDFV